MKLCLSCEATFSGVSWVCPECSWSPAQNGVSRFAPELADSSEYFPRDAIARQSALEEAYFWFRARNELVVWAVSQHFPHAETLLEIGCGTGVVLSWIREALPHLELTGADLLPDALAVARTRVPDGTFAQIDIRRIPYVEEFDVVCALDVLEHVEEDASAVEQIARALRPGGGVVISVPQHAWLWSAQDEFGRHRRRYSRRALLGLLDAAGFDAVRATSTVSLLLPVVAISRLRNRHLTDDYDPFRELTLPPIVNGALGAVMRVERALIKRGVSFPVGSSLVVVGRKR